MPKAKQSKPPPKVVLKTESYDGALLFLLLHKRIVGDPDDFSASENQDNPVFEFNKYPHKLLKEIARQLPTKSKSLNPIALVLSKNLRIFVKKF
jgi:hypothetical protein